MAYLIRNFISEIPKVLIAQNRTLAGKAKQTKGYGLALIMLSLSLGLNAHGKGAGSIMLGAGSGNVALVGDIGQTSSNTIGFSGQFGYMVSEEMIFNVSFLNADHDPSISHRNVSAGVDVYFRSYDMMYAYAGGGISFLTNSFSAAGPGNSDIIADGFGLYGSVGVDFYLNSSFLVGLQARYVKGFETKAQFASGSDYAILDSTSVLARFMIVLGGKD